MMVSLANRYAIAALFEGSRGYQVILQSLIVSTTSARCDGSSEFVTEYGRCCADLEIYIELVYHIRAFGGTTFVRFSQDNALHSFRSFICNEMATTTAEAFLGRHPRFAHAFDSRHLFWPCDMPAKSSGDSSDKTIHVYLTQLRRHPLTSTSRPGAIFETFSASSGIR